MIILFALAIFFTFAIVGGAVVFFVVRNQEDSEPGDLPPRGVPWDKSDQ